MTVIPHSFSKFQAWPSLSIMLGSLPCPLKKQFLLGVVEPVATVALVTEAEQTMLAFPEDKLKPYCSRAAMECIS